MTDSPKVDYDQISATYDDARVGDVALINYFLQVLPADAGLAVLEIGCGTGNYADILQRRTAANVFRVDPSIGMLAKARHKNPHLNLTQGRVEALPFNDARFDFAYMVDVIHHVGDLAQMFAEISRLLKPGATACIVTQSHTQINARPITRFFPATATIDMRRYPRIAAIIAQARARKLSFVKSESLFAGETVEIDGDFLALVRAKGYSMLHLISASAYAAGTDALEHALKDGPIMASRAGETAVWLRNR